MAAVKQKKRKQSLTINGAALCCTAGAAMPVAPKEAAKVGSYLYVAMVDGGVV